MLIESFEGVDLFKISGSFKLKYRCILDEFTKELYGVDLNSLKSCKDCMRNLFSTNLGRYNIKYCGMLGDDKFVFEFTKVK